LSPAEVCFSPAR